MNLNPKMLAECRDVIFNDCDLPESNKEPVHLAVKNLMMLELAYKDFLSREMAGEMKRVTPILHIIDLCGGKAGPFQDWFAKYEQPKPVSTEKKITDGVNGTSRVGEIETIEPVSERAAWLI